MTVQLLWSLYSHWLAASGCGLAPHRQRRAVDGPWVAAHPHEAHQLLETLRREQATVIPHGKLFGTTPLHVARDLKALVGRHDRLTELFDDAIDRLGQAITRAAEANPRQIDSWQDDVPAARIDGKARPAAPLGRIVRAAARGFAGTPPALPEDMAAWAQALQGAARTDPTRLAGMLIAKFNELDGPRMPDAAWRALLQALFLEAGPVVPTAALERLMGVARKWAGRWPSVDGRPSPWLSSLIDVVVWAHGVLPSGKCAALRQALLAGGPAADGEALLALHLRQSLACAIAGQDGPRSDPRRALGKLALPDLPAMLIETMAQTLRGFAAPSLHLPADTSQEAADAAAIAVMHTAGQWLESCGLEIADASALLAQLAGPGMPDAVTRGLHAGIVADALGGRHIDPEPLDRLAHALIQSLLDAPAPRGDRKSARPAQPDRPPDPHPAARAMSLLATGLGEPVIRDASRVRLLRAILAATAQPTSSSTTTTSPSSDSSARTAHALALRGPLVWGLGLAHAPTRHQGSAAVAEPHDPGPQVLMLAQETRTLRPFEQATLLEGLFAACGRLPPGALPEFFDELKTLGIHDGARAALMVGAIEADPGQVTLSLFAQARAALFDAMRGDAPATVSSSSSASSSVSRPIEPLRPDPRLLATLERRLVALYTSFEAAALAASSASGLDTAAAWLDAARRNLRALDHLPHLPLAQRHALTRQMQALGEHLVGRPIASRS